MPRFRRTWSGRQRCRVVITGVGVVSPGGRAVETFWRSLMGTSDAESWSSSLQIKRGTADFSGRIEDFGELPDVQRKLIRKSLKLMNRETQLGVAAGQQALAASGLLEWDDSIREKTGVCFGADNVSILPEDFQAGVRACTDAACNFEIDRWGTAGIPEVEPLWLLKCLPNMPACHLAIINDLQGPNNTITQRDVSANMAVAEACRKIRCGDAPAMLVGATGTTLSTFNQMHARLEGEISDESATAICCPFDRQPGGPAPGEGAAALVLEDLKSARERGATIYGEILSAVTTSRLGCDRGAGAACEQALTQAIQRALTLGGLAPERVGHIHAHGLGTRVSDAAEASAICEVFGELHRSIPVVAAKGRLSHAGAGAGAMELVASVLALQHGELFPLPRRSEPDPDCPLRLVTSRGVPAGESFLNLSLFGRGLASCVAVGRFAA
ncbi:MAG: beta-ketoacyl synthase [Planctomycetaceae bacterium]